MEVKVVYACKDQPQIFTCEVPEHATIQTAISLSGLSHLKHHPVGIFGKILPLSHRLNPGDRVEIYTPLVMDPKQARRLRAKK